LIHVLPIKNKVSNTGYVWESQLYSAGWNDLSDKEKTGVVKETYLLPQYDEICFDIFWPGIRTLTKCVFMGEVKKSEPYYQRR